MKGARFREVGGGVGVADGGGEERGKTELPPRERARRGGGGGPATRVEGGLLTGENHGASVASMIVVATGATTDGLTTVSDLVGAGETPEASVRVERDRGRGDEEERWGGGS